ncbi:MAG: hypothetical protein VKJ24_12100 [Synechococcales bacterium]|nr:hypothetical protein [Synechococcales bacterium]
MQTQKRQKIDLASEYPCPCRRNAKLVPIALTEAFGCDRCSCIFVVAPDGEQIEQLSGLYTYKRLYRWTGHRWLISPSSPESSSLLLVASLLSLLLLLLLVVIRHLPIGGIVLFLFCGLLLMAVGLPLLRSWLARRH